MEGGVDDARLHALQARIRPHFLFNSLNAVLSLIRSDPKRAEAALEDLAELFRRMVFNALISNTDDHPRNHALIAPGRQWELSPAYDLTPNPLTSIEKRDLAMTCGTFNRYANRTNLLSQHGQFKLSREQAEAIVNQVQQVVSARWHAVLRQEGATLPDCEKVAGAFNYPGFELDPTQVLKPL